MFHCPWCGEMVLAGVPHVDYPMVDWEEKEYDELVKNMDEIMNSIKKI